MPANPLHDRLRAIMPEALVDELAGEFLEEVVNVGVGSVVVDESFDDVRADVVKEGLEIVEGELTVRLQDPTPLPDFRALQKVKLPAKAFSQPSRSISPQFQSQRLCDLNLWPHEE